MGKQIYNVEVREIVRILWCSSEFTRRESLKIPGSCLFEYRLYVAGSFYQKKKGVVIVEKGVPAVNVSARLHTADGNR